jgi:hypothetical protein
MQCSFRESIFEYKFKVKRQDKPPGLSPRRCTSADCISYMKVRNKRQK